MNAYTAQRYRDSDTGRKRWAVLHGPSRTWYFPRRHGKAAAESMARRMCRDYGSDRP